MCFISLFKLKTIKVIHLLKIGLCYFSHVLIIIIKVTVISLFGRISQIIRGLASAYLSRGSIVLICLFIIINFIIIGTRVNLCLIYSLKNILFNFVYILVKNYFLYFLFFLVIVHYVRWVARVGNVIRLRWSIILLFFKCFFFLMNIFDFIILILGVVLIRVLIIIFGVNDVDVFFIIFDLIYHLHISTIFYILLFIKLL